MVFISRHVLNNTLPSHVCVCQAFDVQHEERDERRDDSRRREIRDELDEIPLGGPVARLRSRRVCA